MAAPAVDPPQAVLLDLDDTLVPWQTIRHWQWAWRPNGPVLGERHALAAIRRSLHAWDRRRWAGLVGESPPADLVAYRESLRATVEAIAGHPLPPTEAEAVVDRFLRPAHEFESFADAAPAVRELEALPAKVGVVTFLPAELARTMLRRVGLAESLLVHSGDEGPELLLPRSAGFRAAAKRMGVRSSQCAFVGDLFWSDVRAAGRAGVRTVLLDRHDAWPKVTSARLRTLQALPGWVRSPPVPEAMDPADP